MTDRSKAEIETEIQEIIKTRIQPIVEDDGGMILYHSFDNGTVRVSMLGACNGCPSSDITLKNGIENMLKYYVPEVNEVVAE